jgi:phosphate transport system substrate-binding protein
LNPKQTSLAIATTLVLLAAALAGCTANAPPGSSQPSATLTGDGSTFVAPLMDKWRTTYSAANPGVKISYTGGGSGKGRTDVTKGLVDFAGSDAPMSDAEIANATDILHVPVAAGGVAIAYNVPEAGATPLRFTPEVIAGIFLGKITRWNDPALSAANPGVTLPAQDIAVVHRQDGSGTTATFTDYLNKADARWQKANGGPGAGSAVNWPVGTGAPGNNGVGKQIQEIPYSVGYIGSEWGNISKIQTGLVKNKAGNFVAPTPAAVSAALDAALKAGAFDDRLRGSATHTDGADAYPITAVTWVLVHQHQKDAAKGKALAGFLGYVLHDGQGLNEGLNYARVPPSLVLRAEALVNSMDASGQKLG